MAIPDTLDPTDVESLLQDLARRFEPDNEIDGILGPVVVELLFHPCLFRSEGIGGSDTTWRGVLGGLEALVSIKSIAIMLTRMEQWNPPSATAADFERISLLGPLCRQGFFWRDWVKTPLIFYGILVLMTWLAHNTPDLFFGTSEPVKS
jgi:ubiquitin conjugation factor E4 B